MGEIEGAIDWIKVKEEELKRKGYESTDISLLNMVNGKELDKETLEYYLAAYIHNLVMYKNKVKELESQLEQQDECDNHGKFEGIKFTPWGDDGDPIPRIKNRRSRDDDGGF
jgi:hypothetical protein